MNTSNIILVNIINGPAKFIQLSIESIYVQPNHANGTPQPPRNKTEAIIANTPAVANSPIKKIKNLKPEYSVIYPETSSLSAIGMSNGACVSSAWIAIIKMMNPMN